MELSSIVACICEGSAEQAIMEILMEHELLIFTELLDDKIIRARSAKKFEETYLRKGFTEKISIIRILDSKKEVFCLNKLYQDKVDIINVVTAPEIEILIILAEDKYADYQRSRLKPNDFCKINLGYKKVKEYSFVKNYFSDAIKLVSAIKKYNSMKNDKDYCTLFDLLKK